MSGRWGFGVRSARLVLCVFSCLAVFGVPGLASAATSLADKPDLMASLPGVPYVNQVAPVFVDSFVQPGHVLYRFDSEIVNQGGTLDVYRGSGGDAMQVIWPGGVPSQLTAGGYVDPNVAPSDPAASYEDLSVLRGASFVYSSAVGHNHWHFQAAARYVLNLPGGGVRNSAKVGFCMADSNPRYFPYGQTNGGAQTFCAPGNPSAGFVRMGISPGTYDLYNSQVTDQWVDVTGLAPGSYTLTATVNPQGFIDESNSSNNSQTVTRTIPGATAAAASASTAVGAAVAIGLSGTIVGPSVPARQSGSCAPTSAVYACYVTTTATGTLQFAAASAPAHGAVSYSSGGSLSGTATYTPAAGYSGSDAFSYTTTDPRGLKSLPATVTVTIGSGSTTPPTNTALPVISGSPQTGQQLSASTGSWNGNPTPTYTYQWQRCNSNGNTCNPITAATSQTYTPTTTDIASTLRATITARNTAGTATATSNQTAAVASSPAPTGGGSGGGGLPDLGVTMSASAAAPQMGASDEITINVANNGVATSAQVHLRIDLPAGVSLLGPPYYERGSGCTGTQTIDCFLDFIPAGQATKVVFDVRADAVGSQAINGTASGDRDSNLANNAATVTLAVAAAPFTPPVTRPVVRHCIVPNVMGKTVHAAARALKRAGCVLGTIRARRAPNHVPGRVVAQLPAARTRLHLYAKVKLVVSRRA